MNLSPQLQQTIKQYSAALDKMAAVYDTAGSHIADVSVNALGYLPKKYETYKKSIKVAEKMPEGINKLKDFEFDRIQYTRQALLHFYNAMMLLHV